ncbi:hypothetical protein PTKIN_Ptkin14bG0110500 [Pterospermum kingtungense]
MDFVLTKIDESWGSKNYLDEKMNYLKRKLEELNAVKEDMESRTSTELHPRKKLKKEVELWFTNVERINHEIEDLKQKIQERNIVTCGFLKGDVLKKIQEVEELFPRGRFQDSLVVDNPEWIGQALSTTALLGEAPMTCMEEIWAYLMEDRIQKIGVWGMGGIGKTTLMKLVHNQLLKETKKFDIVIWITVSKEMNIIKLQDRIARAMKATLDEEDETIRAAVVYEMLARKGKYVLILDDLWDKLSLEEVGIPEPSNGSKLLVTTRSLEVCQFLDCQQVNVPTLSKPDAWELFLEKVGKEVLNHPDLLSIAESVAEECAGLPLAIVTIASSMKGVRNVHEWRNALNELNRHVKSVNGMEEKVFQQLQFSYDRLQDEKLKHCFLCCALYPEDFEIEIDGLIELWIAEGLVEEMDSLEMGIDRGHAILNKLKNSCLVETTSGDEHATGNKGKVKLHDIVRDMALRITGVKPRFLVRAGMQLKELPNVQDWKEDLEKASFMGKWAFLSVKPLRIPRQMPPPKCPNLKTLLLSRCYIVSIPEDFFEQMHGLKILDLSYNRIESLPNSISNLEALTTLLLHECGRLEEVPSFSKLKTLKKLDLEGTKIKDIPDGMESLVNLKYLNLNRTPIREMNDGILTRFASLQHLKLITSCWAKPGISVRGELIGGLRKLESFNGRFNDLNEWNNYSQALLDWKGWPRQYHIVVGPSQYGTYYSGLDKWIELDGCGICCTHGIKIPSAIQYLCFKNINAEEGEEEAFLSWFTIPVPHNSFSSLCRIKIYECKNIKKLFSSNRVLHNLQNLVELEVDNCKEIEEIIASESEAVLEVGEEATSSTIASSKFITLPKLERLVLWGLPELGSICGANEVMVCDSIQIQPVMNIQPVMRVQPVMMVQPMITVQPVMTG